MKITSDISLININGLPPYSIKEKTMAGIFGGERANSYAKMAIQLSRTVEAAPVLARSTGKSEADVVISAVVRARIPANKLRS